MADPGNRKTLYDSLGSHDTFGNKPPALPKQQLHIPKPPPSPTHPPQFTVSINFWDWLEYYEKPIMYVHVAIIAMLVFLLLRLFFVRLRRWIVQRVSAWWHRLWSGKQMHPQQQQQQYYPQQQQQHQYPDGSGGWGGGGGYQDNGGGGYGTGFVQGGQPVTYASPYATPNSAGHSQYGPLSGPKW